MSKTIRRNYHEQLRIIRKGILSLQAFHRAASSREFPGGLLWSRGADKKVGPVWKSPRHPYSADYSRGVESVIQSLGSLLPAGRGDLRDRVFDTLVRYAHDFLPDHVQTWETRPFASVEILDLLEVLKGFVDSLIPDQDKSTSEALLRELVDLQKLSVHSRYIQNETEAPERPMVIAAETIMPSEDAAAARYKTVLAENIDLLKTECGWSSEVLAQQAGLNERTVKRYLNEGVSPTQKSLAALAGAFSRSLGRPIPATDLKDRKMSPSRP